MTRRESPVRVPWAWRQSPNSTPPNPKDTTMTRVDGPTSPDDFDKAVPTEQDLRESQSELAAVRDALGCEAGGEVTAIEGLNHLVQRGLDLDLLRMNAIKGLEQERDDLNEQIASCIETRDEEIRRAADFEDQCKGLRERAELAEYVAEQRLKRIVKWRRHSGFLKKQRDDLRTHLDVLLKIVDHETDLPACAANGVTAEGLDEGVTSTMNAIEEARNALKDSPPVEAETTVSPEAKWTPEREDDGRPDPWVLWDSHQPEPGVSLLSRDGRCFVGVDDEDVATFDREIEAWELAAKNYQGSARPIRRSHAARLKRFREEMVEAARKET